MEFEIFEDDHGYVVMKNLTPSEMIALKTTGDYWAVRAHKADDLGNAIRLCIDTIEHALESNSNTGKDSC